MTQTTRPDAQPNAGGHRRNGRSVALSGLVAVSLAWSATPPMAQDQPVAVDTQRLVANADVTTEIYFGTVRAREISGLSYLARGCIVEVSDDAKRERVAVAGQVLVKLDDQRSQLALRTAEARLSELASAVGERELAIQAARADDRRRLQDLEFVTEEFERNSSMLRRGLINETSMDAVERRYMDAQFAAERAKETIANAEAARQRAEIALEIGKLDLQAAQLNHSMLLLEAPFDGVLVGFDANVGDCVQEGELSARIYQPDRKSVDVFFRISRLIAPMSSGLSVGETVNVTRVNGEECSGRITRIDSEADLESQFVEATVDIDEACAPNMFLNEAVEIKAVQGTADGAYSVPNTAIHDEGTVFLVDEDAQRLQAVTAEILSHGARVSVVRIPGADGRLLVTDGQAALTDGLSVAVNEPG